MIFNGNFFIMQRIQEYLSTKLNSEQTKAALHIDTSSLILAGAGSGKTRTLTYKIAYLMFGKNVKIDKILAVTFTNKAANEMKERLVSLADEFETEWLSNNIDDSKNKNNDNSQKDDIDEFMDIIAQAHNSGNKKKYGIHDFKWIWTFHSVFLKILKEDIDKLETWNGNKIWISKEDWLGLEVWKDNKKSLYNKNFGILDTNDTNSVVNDILKRLNLKDVFKTNEVKWFISKQKNLGLNPKAFEKIVNGNYDESMYRIYKEYQLALEKSNSVDFDDLLMLVYNLFKQNLDVLEKWQNKFDYIMVDEAQDTNRIQFELMKMMSWEGGNITLIWDDYQSIYWWRGALMENFLNVKNYRPDIVMYKLQINYRSRPHIVQAGNAVIKNNQRQYEKDVSAFRNWEGKITCFVHNTEMDEASNIVQLLTKMKGEKFKSWSEVAILYRMNGQSSPFEQILIQEWIPYKIQWAFKFFERKEVKDVISYLKYIVNPQDSVSLNRIINLPNRKVGKTSIDNVNDFAVNNGMNTHEVLTNIESLDIKVSAQAKSWIKEFNKIIKDLKEFLIKWKPSDMINKLISAIKYKAHILKEEWDNQEKANERLENIWQLINMWEKYNFDDEILKQRILEERTDWNDVILGIDLLRAFLEEITLLSDTMNKSDDELDAIKLMTVHSSKGLEFPFVFVVGLEDNIFPLSSALLESHLLEEERRLMYVAITRAEDHIFLSYANSRMHRWQTVMNNPSRFIEEIPSELLKTYDFSGMSNSENSPESNHNIDEGDAVKHKLFGTWYVLEIWGNTAIVRFHNPKFGVRKIECKFLDLM